MKYELCYLVGESKEQELSRIKEEISGIVSKEGGKWSEPQIEEKRKMAYKVGKEIRGIYVTRQFDIIKDEEKEDEPDSNGAPVRNDVATLGEPSAAGGEKTNPLESISKKLNLYNDILRFIIVKAEDIPELKVRERKPVFAKDSGNGRGNYKKPVYFKKTETAVKEKIEAKKEPADVKSMAGEGEKEIISKEEEPARNAAPARNDVAASGEPSAAGGEKIKDKKSIDEKIDEILNI